MRKFIACFLVMALLEMISSLLLAQQNQNAQKSNPQIEALNKRVSDVEKQLQTPEIAERIDLQAKLAEANAKLADANTKLINADFDKFKGELRIDNEERMRAWSYWFFGILGIIVVISGAAVWFSLKSLIASSVEKNLSGFKEAVEAQDEIKNRLGMLEKQYVASVLESVIDHDLLDKDPPEPIRALREEVLLQVFNDNKTYFPMHIFKAAEVLAARRSSSVISPLLDRLILAADSELNPPIDHFTMPTLLRVPPWPDAVRFLTYMHTLEAETEAYQGLKTFLNYLLTEDLASSNWFLGKTVSSLVQVGFKLNMRDSIPILRTAIPHLQNSHIEGESLVELARYFDIFNEPIGIKEILIYHVISDRLGMEDIKNRCLELLEKYDPDFVEEWRARETSDNSET